MRILVTNCHTRMGYAVAKNLVANGHQVIAAARRVPSMPAKLKGVVGEVAYPDPYIDTEGFLTALCKAVTALQVDVVFPVHEETFVVAKHKDFFANVLLVAPSFRALMSAHDKLASYTLACSAGVDAPLTFSAQSRTEIDTALQKTGWPAIIKPRFGSGANQVRRLRHRAGYDAWIQSVPETFHDPLLVQSYVPGCGVGFGCLVWEEKIRASAGHIRMREIPISGGTSTARRSFQHEKMAAAAHALLRRSGLNGVAMVEFRYDETSDRFAFLEINPRYWGGVSTGIAAGVNFPVLHLDHALGRVASGNAIALPTKTIESRWVMGEIRAAFELASAARISELGRIFRRLPDTKLDLDDFDGRSPGVFIRQCLAYFDGLRKQRSLGGHSRDKDQFFLQENGRLNQ